MAMLGLAQLLLLSPVKTGLEILINDGTSYERPCDSKHQGKNMSIIYYCKNTMEQLHQLLSGLPESKIWVIHLFCGKPVSLEFSAMLVLGCTKITGNCQQKHMFKLIADKESLNVSGLKQNESLTCPHSY